MGTTLNPGRPDLAPTSPHTGGRPQKSTSPRRPLPYGGEVELEPESDHRQNHSQLAPGATSTNGAANAQTTAKKPTLVHPRLAPLAHPRPQPLLNPRLPQTSPHPTPPLPSLRSTTEGQLRHQERRPLQRSAQGPVHQHHDLIPRLVVAVDPRDGLR